jgi:hypothetical protein
MRSNFAATLCLLGLLAAAMPALSQPAQKSTVPAGILMRVDEGVFDLQLGKTIDLTDRKVLLAINLYGSQGACCEIRLNGNRYIKSVGDRLDLKDLRALASLFTDRSQCFLDIVDVIVPQGAPARATFRLHCI